MNILLFYFSASVIVTPLERIASSDTIDCPGDIIPYNCSIQSNIERVHLIWRVMVPGQSPIVVTYDINSDLGHVDYLNSFISTTLWKYRRDEYIESVLRYTVQSNMSIGNQTLVECIITDLANYSTTITITNTSGICLRASEVGLCFSLHSFRTNGAHWIQVHKGVPWVH